MPIMWFEQDVIAFPRKEAEAVDHGRQLRISSAIVRIARDVYQAKCEFIGGGALDWNELTVKQRAAEMQAIEHLVKGQQ